MIRLCKGKDRKDIDKMIECSKTFRVKMITSKSQLSGEIATLQEDFLFFCFFVTVGSCLSRRDQSMILALGVSTW